MKFYLPLLFAFLIFSSCSHSVTNPNSGSGNGGNNNGGSTIDSSYGSATMALDGTTHLTCTNNFFLYDSSNHRLHIQLRGAAPMFIDMSLEMDNLAVGTYNYPSDSANIDAMFTNTEEGFYIPNSLFSGNIIQLTVFHVDLAQHTLSAMLSIHFPDTALHVRSVDSLMLTNVGLAVVPNGHPASFRFTRAADTVPNGDPFSFVTIFRPTTQIIISSTQGDVRIGDTNRQFQLRFNPVPGLVGQYPFPASGIDLTYYWSAFNELNQQVDTNWIQNDGTLNITSYDAGTRAISGNYIGKVQTYEGDKVDSVSGTFENILLND